MKSGSQKTEFQGEFGARHEKNLEIKSKKKLKIYNYPDTRTGVPGVAGSAEERSTMY